MREDFRPVLGHEDRYKINSEGTVVSIINRTKEGNKTLKPKVSNKGYLFVCLYIDGKRHWKRVHRLVWEAFNGKIPEGLVVRHGINTVRTDCCLENLSIGTQQDNINDREKEGRTARGNRSGTSKLSEAQVSYIKRRLEDGEKSCVLAKMFQVHRDTIGRIKNKRQWSHVA